MRTLIGLVVLGAAITGLFLLNRAVRTPEGESVLHVQTESALEVDVVKPVQRDIIRIVHAPGAVEPILDVDISAEVVGKILEMPVDEGSHVRRGDLLCRLDDADYRARVTSAEATVGRLQAAVEHAEAELDKAKRDLERQRALSEADATSALELADYLTGWIRAKATLSMRRQELIGAEAGLVSAREDLDRTIIESPIDGIVSQRFAKQGEVVITGTMNNPGTRIMVVSDLSRMQVRCRVDEGDAALVRPDQSARIYLQSSAEEPFSGRVVRVATKGTTPQGRDVVTFETLVLVETDDHRVKPGMTASVDIEVDRRIAALTIPVQAVVHRKRRDLPDSLVEHADALRTDLPPDRRLRAGEYLMVAFSVESDVAVPKLLEAGISDADRVEILHGLDIDDQVVIGPFRSLDLLKADSKVKVNREETAPGGDSPATKDGPEVAEEPRTGEKSSVADRR